MNLKSLLRNLIPMRWQQLSRHQPLSIVLLLREPHVWTKEELQLAAERAWRVSFADRKANSRHCVAQSGQATLMKAGPHLLNFFNYPKPYLENHKENTAWLKKPEQRQAWVAHAACTGVDYTNDDGDVELGYCVLSKLVAEMLDENCTGLFLPRESSLIPNDRALYIELQKIADSRDSKVVAPASSPV